MDIWEGFVLFTLALRALVANLVATLIGVEAQGAYVNMRLREIEIV